MKTDKQNERRALIEAAAYDLLEQKGFAGTSMLSIAKAAKASNETLYRWYGDKTGLFSALVASNVKGIRQLLTDAMAQQDDPLETLRVLAPILLKMLTSERAIALNRAAAADTTGTLGAAIAQGGRDQVGPLIAGLVSQAVEAGKITAPSPRVAAEWYIALVVGDAQIRRVIGAVPEPSEAHIAQLAETRFSTFLKLVTPGR